MGAIIISLSTDCNRRSPPATQAVQMTGTQELHRRGQPAYRYTDQDIALTLLRHDREAAWLESEAHIILLDGHIYPVDDALTRHDIAHTLQTIAIDWPQRGIETLLGYDGEFCLCVWNRNSRSLEAAVGSCGTRPLFFNPTPNGRGQICIGPEAKYVQTSTGRPSAPNIRAIAQHLALGHHAFTPSQTPYTDVERIPPGCALHWQASNPSQVHLTRFWDPCAIAATDYQPSDLLLFKELCIGSVTQALHHADHPTLTLSGGIDSSTIWAITRYLHAGGGAPTQGLRTLSFLYPDTPSDEYTYIDAHHRRAATLGCYVDVSQMRVEDYDEALLEATEMPGGSATGYQLPLLQHLLWTSGRRAVITGDLADMHFDLPPEYQADALRKGNLWRSLGHAFFPRGRILSHSLNPLKRVLHHALLPVSHPIREWLRPPRPPAWLHDSQHDLITDDQMLLKSFTRELGYGRGLIARRIWLGQLHSDLVTNWQQPFNGQGIQYFSPLGARKIQEWVLQKPTFQLAGRCPKAFVRQAFTGLLTPETANKCSPTYHTANLDYHLDTHRRKQLGNPESWLLCQHRIVNPRYLHETESVATDHLSTSSLYLLERLRSAELYLRKNFLR